MSNELREASVQQDTEKSMGGRASATRARALLQAENLRDMGHCEYDAAWVARVPARDAGKPAFPEVLRVVQSTQAADGGWAPDVNYVSARILATLASILAITEFEQGDVARGNAQRGAEYVLQAWPRLSAGQELTIGFELLAPTLIREGCRRGLPLDSLLGGADALQQQKLKRLPEALVYNPQLSSSFSLEFLGDRMDPERVARLLLKNGSVGASVAATAYYCACTGDEAAMGYLRDVVETYGPDNIPYGAPVTLWPTIWVLHHLESAGIEVGRAEKASALSFILQSFNSNGMTWCELVDYADSDVTALALLVLNANGTRGNWSFLDKFEATDGFLCFLSERGPSSSVNAHVLQALACGAHPESHRMAQKAARFLLETRHVDGCWVDKWHASPHYPTSRAIRGLLAFDHDAAVRPSIEWLLSTQRRDGSWGHYDRASAEETAYAVHALTAWFDAGHPEVAGAIARAGVYLGGFDGSEPKSVHPQLWISKVLYRPLAVVRSAILGAQEMVRRVALLGEARRQNIVP